MTPTSKLPDVNLRELAALCEVTPFGAIVEIGVYQGGSAYALNEVANGRPLHLFDTFTGIPTAGEDDAFEIGAFNDVNVDDVKQALPNAHFHIGIFPDTLPADLKNIAFVHLDCDQYAPTKAAIELLWPRMLPGAIMAFDDYPIKNIRRAIDESFEGRTLFTGCGIPYVIKENA